jgi:hypothetical protein
LLTDANNPARGCTAPPHAVTKLRLLFCVVVGLFGAMHVGAAVGVVQDRVEKASQLARMQAKSLGFEEHPCGAWTWHVQQLPLHEELGCVPGNFLELARVIGVPFSRLRTSIPESLIAGVTSQCVGRRDGLSAKSIEAHAAQRQLALRMMMGETVSEEQRLQAKIPAVMDAQEAGRRSSATAAQDVTPPLQRVAATALVFAVLSMRCLVPEAELAQRHEAAATYFSGHGLDPEGCFFSFLAKFKCMLASDNIRKTGQWADRARLWRAILLSHEDGYFDPSQGLALTLLAVRAKPREESAARTCFGRAWAALSLAVNAATQYFLGASSAENSAQSNARGEEDDDMDDMQEERAHDEADEQEDEAMRLATLPADCPLSYTMDSQVTRGVRETAARTVPRTPRLFRRGFLRPRTRTCQAVTAR